MTTHPRPLAANIAPDRPKVTTAHGDKNQGAGRGLTERQRRFVSALTASGNATHAARVAGYTGSDNTLAVTGAQLLRNAKVATAIAERARLRKRADVMDRDERQQRLSAIGRGELLEPIGIANGKPVFGPPSHDARRKAVMDIARMNGELLEQSAATVEIGVAARSVSVVVMHPTGAESR